VINRIGIGVLALTLAAGPVAAQQHQHKEGGAAQQMVMSCSMMGNMMQMMGMMGDGGMAMMPAMNFLPQHALTHKDALRLTTAQVARIEALGGEMPGARGMAGMPMKEMPMMQGMAAQQERMRTAFEKSPVDEAAIRAVMTEMASMHGRMMSDQVITAAKVRNILTPGQREQLAKLPSPCMKDGAPGQHAPPPAR